MFKKTGRGVSQLAPFFLLENVVYFEISTCKKPLFPDATAFFCVFGYIIFIISPPSLPSHNFTSSPLLSLLSSPLLSSPLLPSPLSLLCLCSVLLSSFFSVLCCCVAVAVSAVGARAVAPVSAVVAARAAAVAAGGFCTFLSGCFSFLGNFSFFLVNFSFTQAIPE